MVMRIADRIYRIIFRRGEGFAKRLEAGVDFLSDDSTIAAMFVLLSTEIYVFLNKKRVTTMQSMMAMVMRRRAAWSRRNLRCLKLTVGSFQRFHVLRGRGEG